MANGEAVPVRLAVLLTALLLCPDATARAQPSTSDRVDNALLNGAVGGVSAGIAAVVKRRPVARAVLTGFGGGVVMGVGKQVAATRFDGSGLLGRQLSGMGLAIMQRATHDTLKIPFPVGPVTVELVPRARDRVRPRVNLMQSVATVYYLARHETTLDPRSTLSTAAPTFRVADIGFSTPWGLALGHMTMGTIVLGRDTDSPISGQTLRHESVHVLQLDYANEIIGFPVERALVRMLPQGERIARHVDLGAMGHLVALVLSARMGYEHQPWEREAYLLAGPWRDD